MRSALQTMVVAGAMAAFAAAGGGGRTVQANEQPGKDGEHLAVPQTTEEHLARAAAYMEKAAGYRREAEAHRKMLADYKTAQSSPSLESKLGQEPPWVKKMRRHCESYMAAAEKMAIEAEKFAEFHRMRGEEMRGK